MNLVLIGNGKWAEKITNSKYILDTVESVERVSASSFLRESSHSFLNDANMVWITSRPSLQGEILSHLYSFGGFVLLEKPIALTLKDFEFLKEGILFEKNRLRLSRVWNYSQVWRDFLSLPKIEFDRIEISRGGPKQNSSISCHLDWMPHDIYLLTELFGEELLNCEILRSEEFSELLKAQIHLRNSQVVVDLNIGHFPNERIAEWKLFHKEELMMTIDFANSQIVHSITGLKKSLSSTDSITRMLQEIKCIHKEGVALDIDVQKSLGVSLLGIN